MRGWQVITGITPGGPSSPHIAANSSARPLQRSAVVSTGAGGDSGQSAANASPTPRPPGSAMGQHLLGLPPGFLPGTLLTVPELQGTGGAVAHYQQQQQQGQGHPAEAHSSGRSGSGHMDLACVKNERERGG